MGKITLVTGGSRSGKSSFAEEILKEKDDVLYIATAIVTDKEMKERIDRHKESRNPKWTTYEGFKDLHIAVRENNKSYILLDCVTVMMTNLLFDREENLEKNVSRETLDLIYKDIEYEFSMLLNEVKKGSSNLIMVTNEVGMGIVPEYKLGRIFRDFAGWINQFLARNSEEVYLVTCGIPLKIK
ncbi:adenosylcobinamide kinase [Clostridium putrefaciens]|uniref:Adenosylcobinamide kinase n=1 Tax=Clostridium putrefaciens TaxID=99675 RepID=A0A381J8C2_9CLOT|nr:bifunctional adenosylcobinamide kinase/adenosylcobinamide-phosphate guanylyltransferase [Clostridium putrefaciens]SUY46938.1 adenosylcobinamide kinase [Clostridium putrefaciens]